MEIFNDRRRVFALTRDAECVRSRFAESNQARTDRGFTQIATKTPGYDIRLTIRIAACKNGRLRTNFSSMRALRNRPIKLANAELFLATGQADRAPR